MRVEALSLIVFYKEKKWKLLKDQEVAENHKEERALRNEIACQPEVIENPVEAISRNSWSADDLIRMAKEKPPEPIIEGLLFKGDILLLHGPEESYKSVFIVQLMESISTGRRLLRRWNVPRALRAGVIETEMHPAMLGARLRRMFVDREIPKQMRFMNDEALKLWRRADLIGKVKMIEEWVKAEGIEVLLIDTANDFFRGVQNPSDERHVGALFDLLRNLSLKAIILVRHDHKRKELDAEAHSNEMIRGSAEWKEDPEAIIHLTRKDKRTHEANLEVGKLRYCAKPAPFTVWFDSGDFRLTPLPPVIAALERGQMTREELLEHCRTRFGIEQRLTDDMINTHAFHLQFGNEGHNRTFQLNREACLATEWGKFLNPPGG